MKELQELNFEDCVSINGGEVCPDHGYEHGEGNPFYDFGHQLGEATAAALFVATLALLAL